VLSAGTGRPPKRRAVHLISPVIEAIDTASPFVADNRGSQGVGPRSAPAIQKEKGLKRSGLSNQNPFGQGRAARDLVPEEPKQTVGLDLTPPDKGASVTTPALTFEKAFHANNSASGGQPSGARPPVTRLECRLTGGNHA